jgi:succinyl-diaminopimelate desuccinylase
MIPHSPWNRKEGYMHTEASVERDLVIDLTRELVRFRSVNPPGGEGEVAEFLAGTLKHHGLEADVQYVEEGRANVVAILKGGTAPPLVFTGHLDVVPPGRQTWEHDPFAADLVDGRIYGRGSADMKGGVAAIVTAMAALAHAGFKPSGDILLAATCGEEAGMLGAIAMVDAGALPSGGRLIVAEPTNLNVFHGEKGVLWLKVRAFGRTAHGSMPHLGINAISAIARLIVRLETYPFPYEESPLLGKPSLSVNVISGGNKMNVVPDLCEIEIDMRTVPLQNHAELVEAVRRLAEECAKEVHPDLRIEVEIDQDVAPFETERRHELVDATIASVRAVRGKAPEVGGVSYGTDGAHLGPGFNMPVVICGPGANEMAHQPDEYVEVEQLVQAAEVYVDLARRLMS